MLRLVRLLRISHRGRALTAEQRSAAKGRAGHARLRLHLQAQDAVRGRHHLHLWRPVRQQNVRAKPAKCANAARDLTPCRYWGTSETLLPVYQTVEKAVAKHNDVDTVVNFASSRSVYSSTMELMEFPQIKSIAIIAEGVPERVSGAVSASLVWSNTDVSSVPAKFCTSPRRRASPSSAPPPSVASSPGRSRLATLVV
jgi:hypothetical protein